MEEAAKQEEEKVEKQQAEEKKRKVEQERKKKLDPTPQNIHVEICDRKSPFCDAVSTVFSCEKGVLVNTKSDHLYFSGDGEKFIPITPNSKSSHRYKDFSYYDGYLIFRDGWTMYFTKNGEDWNSFEFASVLPKNYEEWRYEPPYYRRDPSFHNIAYDDNKKCFVFFCDFTQEDSDMDFMHAYFYATAKHPDGPWSSLNQIEYFSVLEPQQFYFIQGKYYTRIDDGLRKYGYNWKTDDEVYYSEDCLHWEKAHESDQKWLDGLEVENGNRWVHIDYCECKDGLKRYFIKDSKIIPWGKIYFSYNENDVVRAWKEGYERQDVSEECDFPIETMACFNNKLLIFGENNEFAIGEIRVNGSKQRKSLPAKPPKKKVPRKPQPTQEEAILNSMENLAKNLEAISKMKIF